MKEKKRRTVALVLLVVFSIFLSFAYDNKQAIPTKNKQTVQSVPSDAINALSALDRLEVKGRATKNNYERDKFLTSWADVNGCDMRNQILKRDLTEVIIDNSNNCWVIKGELDDPYTGNIIDFSRGVKSSRKVQIDHIVALSDAWQKGAQDLNYDDRNSFGNDPLNLMAVDGRANQDKGGGDAATWLPPNKGYRCRYVARQISVKIKYHLWVTAAEKDSIKRQLRSCPDQVLPIEGKDE